MCHCRFSAVLMLFILVKSLIILNSCSLVYLNLVFVQAWNTTWVTFFTNLSLTIQMVISPSFHLRFIPENNFMTETNHRWSKYLPAPGYTLCFVNSPHLYLLTNNAPKIFSFINHTLPTSCGYWQIPMLVKLVCNLTQSQLSSSCYWIN